MRVAHIITRMIIGGAQENTLLNCLDLAGDYDDDVLLITGPASGPEGDLLDQHASLLNQASSFSGDDQRGGAGRLKIEYIDSLQRSIHPRDFVAAKRLRQVIHRFQPDVVHTHSAKGGLLGRQAAWALGVPAVIHSVHGAPFHPYQSWLAREFFRRCERWAARRCHHMICVADSMTDLMVDAGVAPREKFTTVYSGMDVKPFVDADLHRHAIRSRYGLTDQHVVVGKIARLFHLKGHQDLIAAAGRVVSEVPGVRFLLVGDGILKSSLQRQIQSLGLSRHFIFAGLVAPAEVPSLIGAMDALVHTSYREGLARALPQALIAGRPAVSYDVDGAGEVVINGQTGFLIPPGDVQGLAESIIRLASDPELRRAMGGAGQGRFTKQFDHKTMTSQIRDIYQQVLARGNR